MFVTRIKGIIKMAPKPRKVLQLMRLKQMHNGVFLKVNKPILQMLKAVQPYVTYGFVHACGRFLLCLPILGSC